MTDINRYPANASIRQATKPRPRIAPSQTANARANAAAFAAMSQCERLTGKTGQGLADEQARMRAEFMARDSQRRAA